MVKKWENLKNLMKYQSSLKQIERKKTQIKNLDIELIL